MAIAAGTTPALRDLLVPGKGTVHNRTAQLVRDGERDVVRLDAAPGHGHAWWQKVAFGTGTMTFAVRGRNEPQRSFVGVAFHLAQDAAEGDDLSYGDGLSYEADYFRPFNFLADDPLRRRHMVQYVFPSERHWQRLRVARPGQLEATLDRIPNPDDWFTARVEVEDRLLRVFVAGSETPSLVVERLSARRGGSVGFWVGNGSPGDFASLTLTPPGTAGR